MEEGGALGECDGYDMSGTRVFVGKKIFISSKITKTTDQFKENTGWMEIENVSFDYHFFLFQNFLAMENESEDSGCIDELSFYGNTQTVLDTIPFASCQFNPLEFDANYVRHKFGNRQWISATHEDAVVDCFVENSIHPKLTSMTIGVCDN